jgi:hypothetical protein
MKASTPNIGKDGQPMIQHWVNPDSYNGTRVRNMERLGWNKKVPEEWNINGELLLMEIEQTKYKEKQKEIYGEIGTVSK